MNNFTLDHRFRLIQRTERTKLCSSKGKSIRFTPLLILGELHQLKMMAEITLAYLQFWLLIVTIAVHRSLAQTCSIQSTPSDQLGPFYIPNSPFTYVLAPNEQLHDPLKRLEVFGRVLSNTDCNRGVANVTMEVWYAGEPEEGSAEFYQKDQFRGQIVTNECGEYNFTQTFPALYPSRPIYHNHIRLSRGGQELLVTQMYFQGQGNGYVAENARALQSVAILTNDDGSRKVQFDIYVDAPGNNNSECTNSHSPQNATTTIDQGDVFDDGYPDSSTKDAKVSSSAVAATVVCSFLAWILSLSG